MWEEMKQKWNDIDPVKKVAIIACVVLLLAVVF